MPQTDFLPAERLDYQEILDEFHSLANSSEFNKTLLDKIPFIILILNKYRQVVFANKYFKDVTNLKDLKQFLGKRPGEIFNCLYSDINPGGCGTSKFCSHCGAANAILSSLKKICDSRECTITQKNGNCINLQVCAEPYKFKNKDYNVFIVQDISDKIERTNLENLFFGSLKQDILELKTIAQILKSQIEENYLIKDIEAISDKILSEINLKKIILDAENFRLEVNPVSIFSDEIINEILEKINFSKRSNKIENKTPSISFISDYYLLTVVLEQMIKYAVSICNNNENIIITGKEENNHISFSINFKKVISLKNQYEIFHKSSGNYENDIKLQTYLVKLITTRYLKGLVKLNSKKEEGSIFSITLPLVISKDII